MPLTAIALGAYDFYEKPVNYGYAAAPGRQRPSTSRNSRRRTEQLQYRADMNRRSTASSPPAIHAGGVPHDREGGAHGRVRHCCSARAGTGKELLARALHRLSTRAEGNLRRDQLRGDSRHPPRIGVVRLSRRAHSPARTSKPSGKFESRRRRHAVPGRDRRHAVAAAGEDAALSSGARRSSASAAAAEIPVDVRVLCATNQNIATLIADGRFREDLYYRIAEITIDIPPLRDREEGRLLLAHTLLHKFTQKQRRSLNGFSEDAVTPSSPTPGRETCANWKTRSKVPSSWRTASS